MFVTAVTGSGISTSYHGNTWPCDVTIAMRMETQESQVKFTSCSKYTLSLAGVDGDILFTNTGKPRRQLIQRFAHRFRQVGSGINSVSRQTRSYWKYSSQDSAHACVCTHIAVCIHAYWASSTLHCWLTCSRVQILLLPTLNTYCTSSTCTFLCTVSVCRSAGC